MVVMSDSERLQPLLSLILLPQNQWVQKTQYFSKKAALRANYTLSSLEKVEEADQIISAYCRGATTCSTRKRRVANVVIA